MPNTRRPAGPDQPVGFWVKVGRFIRPDNIWQLMAVVAAVLGISGAGTLIARTAIPPLVQPKILRVTPIEPAPTQTIFITGSGFGTHAPFVGDLPCIALADTPAQAPTGQWSAGHSDPAGGTRHSFGPCSVKPSDRNGARDYVTLKVSGWSDRLITITGLSGQYGAKNQYFDWSLRPGDRIDVEVANAQSGAGPDITAITVM